jgi:hypothetical protein
MIRMILLIGLLAGCAAPAQQLPEDFDASFSF